MKGQYVWVSDPEAGPLVLVRKALLDFWGGASDCERARAAVRELGCVDMKGGSALFFGNGARTTWMPKAQGGLFVRWIAANDEAAAITATDASADTTWMPTGCTFTTGGGVHVLFAAREKGTDTHSEQLAFELKEGDYDILCSVVEEADASVLVYRLMWRPRGQRR